MTKERLDVFLVKKGHFKTRERAKGEIMAGNILVGNEKITKAGHMVSEEDTIRVLVKDFPYVSRGALKLVKGLEAFSLDVTGAVCLDIGASTGGFTEILLLNGARKVYSVDVGHNQLAWKLRNDSRVVVMEKVNGRYLTPENFDGTLMDVLVTDVSFISLEKILPAAKACLKPGGRMIALIKPQFEAGKDGVNKKGVVTDYRVRVEVVKKIISFSLALGFSIRGLALSPIKGPKGNIEYLIYLVNDALGICEIDEETLHEELFKEDV